MRFPVVLWDFDGTLADTFACTVRVYNRLAPAYGLRPIDDPQAVRGMTVPQFLRAHRVGLWKLPSLVLQVLVAQKEEVATLSLFPGVSGVLEELSQAGTRMAVLSSNAEGNIRACLKANGVEGFFEAVVGYRRLFGKGRGIRGLLKGRGLVGPEVVYVGDEVRDIQAARKAGVAAAAVTWGFNSRDLLARHAPDYLADSPEQLL